MAGINSGNPLAAIKGANGLNQRETGERLGVSRELITALKSGSQALSPDMAKRVAAASDGAKAGNLYLVSQMAVLKSKIADERITASGVGRSVVAIEERKNGQFQKDDFDQSDEEFRKALADLKTVASNVMDMIGEEGEEGEGDEPKVAAKSATGSTGGIERDVYGRRMGEASPGIATKSTGSGVERDVFGRRMN